MSYLLDTNILSEVVKPAPDMRVWRWLDALPDSMVFISAITIGEIQRGIERLAYSRRRTQYELWLRDVIVARYSERILGVDLNVMMRWADLMARLEARGRALPAFDSLIAATALAHDLRLVTRNTRDFVDTGVEVIDPWQIE